MNLTKITKSLSIIEKPDNVLVTNGLTEILFMRATGCILEIRNSQTGKVHCSVVKQPEYARLFRIVSMRQWAHGYACDANAQKDVIWHYNDNGITISYPALIWNEQWDEQTSGCSAIVRLEAVGDDEIRLSLEIKNTGEYSIYEIQFPMLPGWQDTSIDITGGANWKWQVGKLPSYGGPSTCQFNQHVSAPYPGSLHIPWLDLSGQGGGVSFINYMEQPFTGGISGTNPAGYEKGSMECYWWRHYPLLKKGDQWTSPPIGISLHESDWHCTADRYYDWFQHTIGVMEQPDSLRTSIGFQNIKLRHYKGIQENEIESLVEHARTGKKYGVRHLAVWEHLTLGNYEIYDPDIDMLDYAPQEFERLRDTIALVKQEDVTISALINFRYVNVRSPIYEQYRSEAVCCLDGSEWRMNYCSDRSTSPVAAPFLGLNLIVLSPRSPLTRSRVYSILDRYLNLGYNALFYDQPFIRLLDYNFQKRGDRPDDASSALFEIIYKIRTRLKAVDDDAYIIGENFEIFSYSKAIDMHMQWHRGNNIEEDIDSLVRTHYACPHALLSYVIDYTISGEPQASRAFAGGLLLCIHIDGGESNLGKHSELANHIARLAALRERCASRMAFARFRETVGLELDADVGIVAYSYDSSSGPAVVIAAGENGGTARVSIDLSRFQTPVERDKGKLFLLNGEELEVNDGNRLEQFLEPNQVIVWYC